MSKNGFEKKDATARGLFIYAHAYWISAAALETFPVRSGHRGAPINYLYFHAIELFMKSFLLHSGSNYSGLKDFGHKQKEIAKDASSRGLQIDGRDLEILALIDENYLEARYLKTGPFTRARTEELWGLCSVLFDQIGGILQQASKLKRLPERPDWPFENDKGLTVDEVAKLLSQRWKE